MEQPNVTGDGDVPLTPAFWVALVVTGIATGLFGDLMMVILFGLEHLTYNYHSGSFQSAVERVAGSHRVIALAIAGAFGGVAWYVLRKFTKGKSEIDDALWAGDGRLAFWRSLGTSAISEVVIGMGASIGREAAPKLMGGVSGSVASDWFRLTPGQRRLLVACGGGAGLASVYNVPLGGALFTAEIMVGSVTLPVVLPAIVCTLIATATSWLYLPHHATYVAIPTYHLTMPLFTWSVLVGPLVGIFAAGYVRLVGMISHYRAKGPITIVTPLVAFTVLGIVGIKYPQLFGNGKDMAHMVFVGGGSLLLLAALSILKPLMTTMCLSSGASGGLFTPVLSTGAVLGGALGLAWSLVWPGSPVGAYALIGAAAMIGSAMQAPLSGLALVLELTHSGFEIMVPMMLATAVATYVVRMIDGYSIYSARLQGE